MFNTVIFKANHPNGLTWIDNSRCVFFRVHLPPLLFPGVSRKTGMSWSFGCPRYFYSRILSSYDDVNSCMALGIPKETLSHRWQRRCIAGWSVVLCSKLFGQRDLLGRRGTIDMCWPDLAKFSCLWKNVVQVQVWKICMIRLDASMNSANVYIFFVYWLTPWYIHTCAHTYLHTHA